MAYNNGGSSGDTMEFLKIMGVGAAADAPAPDAPRAPERPAAPAKALAGLGGLPEVTFTDMPAVVAAPQPPSRPRRETDWEPSFEAGAPMGGSPAPAQPPAALGIPSVPEEPKPVVIKGGPRRVVRADGRQPETSFALGQKRFALSSGHALFAPKKRRHVLRDGLLALLAMALVAAVFAGVWFATQAGITKDMQNSLVGTSAYDGALSLTPANDGGYYTAFVITTSETDEEQIAPLSRVVLYRYDKGVASVTRAGVPANLYVAPSGSSSEAHTLKDVCASQSVTRVLQAIDAALGTRLYNVVVTGEDAYADYEAVLTGAVDPASVDASSYLGRVRSNLSLEGIVELCGKIGAVDQATVRSFNVPTTDLNVNGVVMAQCTPDTYRSALTWVQSVPPNTKYDENGNFVGTQYDEWGNPIVDETGAPAGSLRDETGKLVFDENGYLQFWGQQYDANGMPVGTQYDEWGNPLYDSRGNPLGTQYDEWGNPLYDWRGNLVIVNG